MSHERRQGRESREEQPGPVSGESIPGQPLQRVSMRQRRRVVNRSPRHNAPKTPSPTTRNTAKTQSHPGAVITLALVSFAALYLTLHVVAATFGWETAAGMFCAIVWATFVVALLHSAGRQS